MQIYVLQLTSERAFTKRFIFLTNKDSAALSFHQIPNSDFTVCGSRKELQTVSNRMEFHAGNRTAVTSERMSAEFIFCIPNFDKAIRTSSSQKTSYQPEKQKEKREENNIGYRNAKEGQLIAKSLCKSEIPVLSNARSSCGPALPFHEP